MLLHDLLGRLDRSIDTSKLPNVPVTGVEEDSRKIARGNLFIARKGLKSDGHQFISDAFAHGACAVVTETASAACALPQILVRDAGRAASILSNAQAGDPSQSVKVLAITGTNGKTTTAYLLRHMLGKVGRRCGLIGTVQIDDGKNCFEADMTTPSATDVAKLLATMRGNNCGACALEASSHALDQGRVDGVRFAGAAFTNLTGDHLDYHKSMEAYAAAKARLFKLLGNDAIAVVNAKDPWADRIALGTRARLVSFGFDAHCDYWARDVAITANGSNFVLITPDGQAEVSMRLIGRHNIENALTASALIGETFGLSVHQIAAALKDATGAPGRLQPIRRGQPFTVLVDYAHSDDALENVLSALRPLTHGRLRVIFGCGGDRDRTKRPRMARAACRLADEIFITSDNPRTESPDAIVQDILAGIPSGETKPIHVELDRRTAIAAALSDARSGDVVLLAGKGHENYQIIGTTKHHFDDVEEASAVIARMNGSGVSSGAH